MHLSEGGTGVFLGPVLHSEMKIRKESIDTTEAESSVSQQDNAMSALGTLPTAKFSICSLHNIDFRILVRKQEFETGEELAMPVVYLCADIP